MTMSTTLRRPLLAGLAAAGALALSACGSTESAPAATTSPAASASSAATTSSAPASASSAAGTAAASSTGSASESAVAAPLRVVDPWTKATEEQMTGSFGVLENTTDQDVHVVAVTSDAAPRTELHHMVPGEDGQMRMEQAPDGFTIPAGESVELAPGGNHVMLMGLTDPIEPGEEVSYTLELEDGSTVEVTSLARPFAGANESYHGGEAEGSGHGDH